jgi:hypothetical protein
MLLIAIALLRNEAGAIEWGRLLHGNGAVFLRFLSNLLILKRLCRWHGPCEA